MIVQILVAAFFIIGVIDHFFGNRLKLGEEFYKGLSTFPSLILGMLGIYSLSPLLGKGIQFIFSPVSRFSGLDVTFFSSVLLGTDMGGYRIAKELAESPEIGRFCGIILTSLYSRNDFSALRCFSGRFGTGAFSFLNLTLHSATIDFFSIIGISLLLERAMGDSSL